jgi:hypothetical protein
MMVQSLDRDFNTSGLSIGADRSESHLEFVLCGGSDVFDGDSNGQFLAPRCSLNIGIQYRPAGPVSAHFF